MPMPAPPSAIPTLEERLHALEAENAKLREQLVAVAGDLPSIRLDKENSFTDLDGANEEQGTEELPLSLDEYKRYGRQMIVPSIGLPGQLRLKSASVLIIGAGGLGCPAASYLAGAGVGKLGICDGDTVETSNLHRQISHSTTRVGMTKVQSMVQHLQDLNPHVTYCEHLSHLTPETAAQIIEAYDLVLDCTDQPSSRYLISDACVLLSKPLVSASALRTDGQLMLLNYPPGVGACYRCVWPKPPPAESVISCGEGGILGPVVGVMGVLMATEGIKVLTGNVARTEEQRQELGKKTNMLLYSAYGDPMFRTLKLRGKKRGCVACDEEKKLLTLETLREGRVDYVAFCGVRNEDRVTEEEKVDVRKLKEVRERGEEYVLIDVREEVEWGICRLGGINVPITKFIQELTPNSRPPIIATKEVNMPSWLPENRKLPIYIICKQGNDSQVAVKRLKSFLSSLSPENADAGLKSGQTPGEKGVWEGGIWDVKGGLAAWRQLVDEKFPEY